MHIEEAVQWVEMNKRIIINFSRKYLQFTPYDIEDMESAAKHAAILVAMQNIPPDPKIFESHFWVHYKSLIREIVPFNRSFFSETDEKKYDSKNISRWSQSVSSAICVDIDEVKESMISIIEDDHEEAEALNFLSETVFWSNYHMLTPMEQKVLYCRLGFSNQGALTLGETAQKIGIVRSSAFNALKSAMNKISKAVQFGLIEMNYSPSNPEIQKMERQVLEQTQAA